MEPKRSNHFLAHLPTILLLVLFAMSPWLGILFFILRAIDRDAERKEQTNADPARDSHAEDARTAQSAASGQRSETVSDQDVPTAEQKSAKQWHKTLTTLCTIFGAIFLLVGIGNVIDVQVLGHPGVLRTAIIFFYLSNEGLSLTENAAHLGLPVPEKLKEVLEKLHDRHDEEEK